MATYHLKISDKRPEGEGAASIWLDVPRDLSGAFDYSPGQFLTVETDDGGERIARQYSLSSTPGSQDGLRITVRKIDGGRMSGWLVEDVAPGQTLEVQVPRGRFFRPLEGPHHVLMLAAGSGIAPILSIGRWLLESDLGHVVTFVYGNRAPDSVILGDEVEALAGRFVDRCRLELLMSRANGNWDGPRGRIDRAYIESRFAVWTETSDLPLVVYLCGPEAFMDSAESALLAAGVPQGDINRESFDMVLNDDADEPGIVIAGTDEAGEEGPPETITAIVGGEEYEADWQDGESILDALLRTGADVPFSCQEGTCSSCISKLTKGTAEVRPGVLQTLRQEDLDEGLTLACLSIPRTKAVRIDFDEI